MSTISEARSPIATSDRVAALEQRIATAAHELAIPDFRESAQMSDRERIAILEDRLEAMADALAARSPIGSR